MKQATLCFLCAVTAFGTGVAVAKAWRLVAPPVLISAPGDAGRGVKLEVPESPSACAVIRKRCGSGTLTDEQTVLGLARELAALEAAKDSWEMEPLIAEDFVNTNPDGTLETKAQRLGRISPMGRIRISSSDISDLRVRVLDEDTAVATYRVRRELPGRILALRVTDTWEKRQGRWQLLAAHETEIRGERMPVLESPR